MTIEQALEIAQFRDNQIHCFVNAPMGLVGNKYTLDDFMQILEESDNVEIGSSMCRKMDHALILWVKGVPFFFEHDEEKLKGVFRQKRKVK